MARSLDDWLTRLEAPTRIELGLDRVQAVCRRMRLEPRCPVITVGGTNGKGSTCACLEAVLTEAGYRVGLYTSPHLLTYNERVRVACAPIDDDRLVAAFEAVEAARGETPLTYFEFGTLAAMRCFLDAGVEVIVLEVGLGGRLDAVNAWDADAAIVTTVDLDHQAFLGDTREAIGFEKAGIYRTGRPAVCADPAPPASLIGHARRIGARLMRLGADFGAEPTGRVWDFWCAHRRLEKLPQPALPGAFQLRNAAAALAALDALSDRLTVPRSAIERGLAGITLWGRFQRIATAPDTIVDVAHNPESARALASLLAAEAGSGRTLGVVGMLADKDADGVIAALAPCIAAWWVCTPDSPRARPAADLADMVRRHCRAAAVTVTEPPTAALEAARSAAREGDRIVAFGSFVTVATLIDHARAQY